MAKKKIGRPKGSTNKTYMHAVEIPAACPKCASTQLYRVTGNPPIIRDIEGKLATGEEYGKVTWTRRKCRQCGQHVTVRAYLKKRRPENISNENTKPAV